MPAKEKDTQRLIIDWLNAKGIWHERRNTGAFTGQHNGRSRFVRFSRPGTADIMAWQVKHVVCCYRCQGLKKRLSELACPVPDHEEYCLRTLYWIECKSSTGKQSEEQKAFQAEVEAQGMRYILARSLEDVTAVLE